MSNNSFEMPQVANEKINIESVTKRDGTLAPFDSSKIYNAINKAGLLVAAAELTYRVYHLIFLSKSFTVHCFIKLLKGLFDLLAIIGAILIIVGAAKEP